MSREVVEIDTHFRPPVVKYGGRSPLRSSKVTKRNSKSPTSEGYDEN